MTSTSISIAVISDFACPWCLVGLHRLRKAIELRPSLNFSLSWQPFQLNPDLPREGQNRREYYRNKFGDEGTRAHHEALKEAGLEEGIIFCDTPDAIAPNTLSAHVLMLWAANDESVNSNALAEKLFNAHHIECENIGDFDVLTRIAEEVGMNRTLVSSKLASGDDEAEVTEQICRYISGGVSGVPFFIFNDKYGISGAQPPDTLVSIFDQVSSEDG